MSRRRPLLSPLLLLLLLLLPAPAWATCPSPLAREELMEPFFRNAIVEHVWETVRDNYLYPDYRGLDWQAARTRYQRRVRRVRSNVQLYRTVDAMIAELKDDHSIYLSPWETCEEDLAFGAAPGSDAVPIPAPLVVRLDGELALLHISSFDAESIADEVEGILAELLAEGPLAGLVLDLRGNPGGFLDVAYSVLSHFVPGPVGSEVDSLGRYQVVLDEGSLYRQLRSVPLVVLVDGGTESSAELVAGVLQHRGRARVVGSRSAGNTEIITPFDFLDGSRLWLAVAAFEFPDGSSLEGVGIIPDLPVAAGRGDRDPVLTAALKLLRSPATP